MPNKQKTIKLFIFSIVIFTLLINLICLSYERIYTSGNYATHNSEVANYYKSNYPSASLEVRQQTTCSNLKFPFGNIEIYYKLFALSILATIISIIIVFISLVIFLLSIFKKHEKTKLSHNDMLFIASIELISFLLFIWFFAFEPDYSFTYCVNFL